MNLILTKKFQIAIAIAVLLALAIGIYLWKQSEQVETVIEDVIEDTQLPAPTIEVIGSSVEGREIYAHTYGSGPNNLLFVGGIHGGYEWNSVLLAYRFIDYLEANPGAIPEGLSITVVPSLNPDGVFDVTGLSGRFSASDVMVDISDGTGRFNANNVDLNRNFDCKWQPTSTWRGNTVSAGTKAFSEPESAALRDLVMEKSPKAVIFWHSQASAVYASECEEGVLNDTLSIMNLYASSAGYKAVKSFDAYPVSGDAEGWLASIGIPAITVELSTHESIEWEKNLAGTKAVIDHYSRVGY